jgi:hypothetical protein
MRSSWETNKLAEEVARASSAASLLSGSADQRSRRGGRVNGNPFAEAGRRLTAGRGAVPFIPCSAGLSAPATPNPPLQQMAAQCWFVGIEYLTGRPPRLSLSFGGGEGATWPIPNTSSWK